MIKKPLNEKWPERKNPGDPEVEWCSPGSIEQQLDMCEEGSLRGDEIIHQHGIVTLNLGDSDPVEVDRNMEANFNMDLSEENREGSEMSDDEYSGKNP